MKGEKARSLIEKLNITQNSLKANSSAIFMAVLNEVMAIHWAREWKRERTSSIDCPMCHLERTNCSWKIKSCEESEERKNCSY